MFRIITKVQNERDHSNGIISETNRSSVKEIMRNLKRKVRISVPYSDSKTENQDGKQKGSNHSFFTPKWVEGSYYLLLPFRLQLLVLFPF